MNSRRAKIALEYQGKDISGSIKKDVLSVSYQEGFGQADTVNIALQDRDDRWLLDWEPKTGDRMKLQIKVNDWEDEGDTRRLNCGAFIVDEIEYAAPPRTVAVKGTSLPSNSNFIGTPHSRTWKAVTLKSLFQSLLPNDLSLSWQAVKNLKLAYAEQDEAPDLEYISALAVKYGLRLKILNNRLVVWDAWELDALQPVNIFQREDLSGYTFRQSATRTRYDACRVRYQPTGEGSEITYTYPSGGKGKLLEVSESVFSVAEAEAVARSALWAANITADEADITLTMGNPSLYGGKNIELKGFGTFDGVYGIDGSSHELSSSGYITTLTMHKVLKEPAPIANALSEGIKVGDSVKFTGGSHYAASTAVDPTGNPRTAGTAKVTIIKIGTPHPYHIIGVTSNVYGWVDTGTISKEV